MRSAESGAVYCCIKSLRGGAARACAVRVLLSRTVSGKLSADAFSRPEQECPGPMIRLLQNLLVNLANTSARLTADVAALEG